MCGIFGYLSRRRALPERISLQAAVAALSHRGPDDAGTFTGEAGGTLCGLAHTRLAIIDLSPGGHQPMRSADGRYVIVYNGEVYNYAEVRTELEAEGLEVRSGSDTEVILQAYAQWGASALDRLRGMFAFAIWDTRLGDLFLARDRLGIKPLYVYTTNDGDIAFASEVRTLLKSGAAPPRLSPAGVASYLQWGSVAEPHTILANVEALPAGSHRSYRAGKRSETRYWQPRIGRSTVRSFDEAAEQVAPLLRKAVALRLVADVPVGVFLSGGIDSSVITALAAAESPKPLHTFTVTFDEDASNEAEHASAVAKQFECVHHEVLLNQARLGNELGDALGALDQPSADGINTYFVSQAVRSAGISVVLSGLGGDEVFAGYHHFREFGSARRLAGAVPPRLGRLLESLTAHPALGRLPRRAPKVAALLAGSGGPFETYSAIRCMFTPRQARSLLAPSFPEWSGSTDAALEATLLAEVARGEVDPVNLFSVLDLSNYMRNTLLRDADVMSMAHALEVRVPLLDHVLVEHVLSVPGRLKLSKEINKPLLVAAAPVLPDRVFRRGKMGFTLPWETWLRGALKPRMSELLGTTSTQRQGFLRPDEVGRIWGAFLADDHRVTFSRVWCLAVLADWCERNRVTL